MSNKQKSFDTIIRIKGTSRAFEGQKTAMEQNVLNLVLFAIKTHYKNLRIWIDGEEIDNPYERP